jgi:hypothetical protein
MTAARKPIYEDSPKWIEMSSRVATLTEILANAAKTIRNTERALMGGLDDSGTAWIEGIREKVQRVDDKVDALKVQNSEDLESVKKDVHAALDEVRATKRTFYTMVATTGTAAVTLVVELLNSYFGWFGSAHVVLHTIH